MTKTEKRQVADLIERANCVGAAMAKFDPNWATWRKQAFWNEWEPIRDALQAEVKTLTGVYVGM